METANLMNTEDLADYLGVPIETVRQWRYSRTGPPGFRLGRRVKYRRSDVDAWIEDRITEENAS